MGPTGAAILSTAEPLATVMLAFVIFGEPLGPLQLPAARSCSPPVPATFATRPREVTA